MKILIVGFAKIKYMPYANFYLDNIDCEQHEVDFLYWNRDLKAEDTSNYRKITLHEFRCYQEDNVSRLLKIKSFFKFRQHVKKLLKAKKYDFVIVLHTMAAVLLQDVWSREYGNRFIFDYRDSTYERFPVFRWMIANLIKNSRATFTSSDGFRCFFPEDCSYKIYTTHNILMESLGKRSLEHIASDKVRIAFWGFIREEDTNREIISKIAKDERFELHFYGREQATAKRLREYARSIQAENVFFHGEYVPSQRYEFAANTDLIHNIYKNRNMMLAMSNKYYDSGLFYLPQLCMKGSFMAHMSTESGIGFACDPWTENFTQTIYQYYGSMDRQDFRVACDREIKRVADEYQRAVGAMHACLQG